MTITRISFQSIPVDDQDRALAFYHDVMGFTVQLDVPYEDGWRWIFLQIPGSDSRIQFGQRGDFGKTEKPILALVSDDVDAECARLEAAGMRITNEPQDAPWAPGVRWTTIRDSEDNIIFIESMKSEEA